MIETHPNPAQALSDGPQSLTLPEFQQLMQELNPLAQFFDRGSMSTFKASTFSHRIAVSAL